MTFVSKGRKEYEQDEGSDTSIDISIYKLHMDTKTCIRSQYERWRNIRPYLFFLAKYGRFCIVSETKAGKRKTQNSAR